MPASFPCQLIQKSKLTDTVISFRFSYPLSNEFLPGQFVMLQLPIQSEFTLRSYSIASAPNNDGWIELCIVKKEGGPGTAYLFDALQVGDKVEISSPEGKFLLTELDNGLVMVCTGTGVAPFRSMIRAYTKQDSLKFPLYLVFGNRTVSDILYYDEWLSLAEKDPNFHFIPVLSREENWDGPKGYVHASYLELANKHPEYYFYLCGWSAMVREAKNNLRALGFSRKQVKFELYD